MMGTSKHGYIHLAGYGHNGLINTICMHDWYKNPVNWPLHGTKGLSTLQTSSKFNYCIELALTAGFPVKRSFSILP